MLGVSIVLYGSRPAHVRATLGGLAAQTLSPDAVVIHENPTDGPPGDSGSVDVEAWADPLPVIATRSDTNLGFSAAHNRSLQRLFESGCDAVVVLNPDLILDPSALAELRCAADRLGNRCLLGPVLELCDPDTLVGTGTVDTLGVRWTRSARHIDIGQGEPLPELDQPPVVTAAVSGACVYVPRAAHDQLVATTGEFFDEDFFAYREDAELGYRASLLGLPSYVVPTASGRHVRRLRGTQRGLDADIDRLGVRNRFLFAFKYGGRRPGWPPLAYGRDVMVIAAALTVERTSLHGVREAWRLRATMRAKRARLEREVAAGRR